MNFQGPVLSGHQKLVVEKLAEEESGKKVKREAKKEKHLVFHFSHHFIILIMLVEILGFGATVCLDSFDCLF